jgi:pyruvate/2-oxoglutarate dehydrogenase complex dihydrolipoamide acyltransferase (E2) component
MAHKVTFPESRLATMDVFEIARRRHHIKAMLEVDVTEAWELIKSSSKKSLFTAWLLKVIGDTLGEHPEIHAFRSGRRGLLLFDQVDCSLVVERVYRDKKVPIPIVIRATDRKSLNEIREEIREAKKAPIKKGEPVLKKSNMKFWLQLYYRFPPGLRRLVWRIMLARPKWAHRMMGSVSLTSVGMFGQVKGWFIHTSIHPIGFGIGAVIPKPAVYDNKIQIRQLLHLTVLMDHAVVDGAPMARFIQALTQRMEQAWKLESVE